MERARALLRAAATALRDVGGDIARQGRLREDELAAGFVECRYIGLVTLTARTAEDLDVQAADLEQAAANSGVELQPLKGRQADGWVASLPLGRTVARQFGAT